MAEVWEVQQSICRNKDVSVCVCSFLLPQYVFFVWQQAEYLCPVIISYEGNQRLVQCLLSSSCCGSRCAWHWQDFRSGWGCALAYDVFLCVCVFFKGRLEVGQNQRTPAVVRRTYLTYCMTGEWFHCFLCTITGIIHLVSTLLLNIDLLLDLLPSSLVVAVEFIFV